MSSFVTPKITPKSLTISTNFMKMHQTAVNIYEKNIDLDVVNESIREFANITASKNDVDQLLDG